MTNIPFYTNKEEELYGRRENAMSLKPVKVQESAGSEAYQKTLNASNGMTALKQMARGNPMGALMGATGMGGGLGTAHALFNPATTQAQTQMDTTWLSNSRVNDFLEQAPSFRRKGKISMASSNNDRYTLIARASHAREAIDRGEVRLFSADRNLRHHVKTSSARVKVSSPFQNENIVIPVLAAKKEEDLIKHSTAGSGGGAPMPKNPPKPIPMTSLEMLEDVARGVWDGKNMIGKSLRLPLALGGLVALDQGIRAFNERKHNRGSDYRFEQGLNTLRQDPNFRDSFEDLIDPTTEVGQQTIPQIRQTFDVLDKYAPDVTSDPMLLSNYLGRAVSGVDQTGIQMTPEEYLEQTQQALSLQEKIDRRNSMSIFDGVGSLTAKLIGE